MINNVFTMRNVFCPHKDYIILLGGKLTIFKLCNYGIMLTKVSRVILGIVSPYFIVYGSYFVVGEFFRTIRVVYVYFIVYASFSYL
jgi:hypothetical protein